MNTPPADERVQVTYLELRHAPAVQDRPGAAERIERERPGVDEYLGLYRAVGTPLRWDQRLQMPRSALGELLAGEGLRIHVLRAADAQALGFCEFEWHGFPDVELKNFGLLPAAQGRGLGSWLLSVALRAAWAEGPARIWLHTDAWDHPAAVRVYERAGFQVFAVREEAAGPL